MKIVVANVLLIVIGCLSLVANAQSVDFQSSNLPIIVIDTEGRTIVDEPKIRARMGIINNPAGLNQLTDEFTDYDGVIGIEFRGSSSQDLFPKKSFGFETWDEAGQDLDTALLGFPSEEDWIFYGPFSDKSLVRNKLTFDLFAETGRYSSRTKFVEIVLNGQYHGLYVFMEKVKRDDNRVNIANLRPEENSGIDLTGGYILKLDKFTGGGGEGFASEQRPPNFKTENQQIFFQYEEPAYDEITAPQREYIQTFMRAFEQALVSNTYRDPISGYRKYINVDTFVDFFLINELNRNVDGYRLSTFMYKDKDDDNGGKLSLGPIWDFNLAFGNANYCDGGSTTGWAWEFNEVCPNDFWLVPFWWERIMSDPAFRSRVKVRWLTLRNGAWSDEALDLRIAQYADQLADASQRNLERWPEMRQYVWPNNFVGANYAEEIDFLKGWVDERVVWLDQQFDSFEGETIVTGLAGEVNGQLSYPNPFSTEVSFRAKKGEGIAAVKIYSYTGQFIQTINGSPSHGDETVWDGRNASGIEVPPGIYLYQAHKIDGSISIGKIIKSGG